MVCSFIGAGDSGKGRALSAGPGSYPLGLTLDIFVLGSERWMEGWCCLLAHLPASPSSSEDQAGLGTRKAEAAVTTHSKPVAKMPLRLCSERQNR